MGDFTQDVRFAFRSARRRPALWGAAILTLAIAIGANASIFSVLRAVLADPPSYREADRLGLVWHRLVALEDRRVRVAAPDADFYAQNLESLDGVAFVAGTRDLTLGQALGYDHIRVGVVTPSLFDVLGVRPVYGRTFRDGEGVGGATPDTDGPVMVRPVILSHSAWVQRFGADEGVIGRTVRISAEPMTIVGVLPGNFELLLPTGLGLPEGVEAWTPLAALLGAFRRPEGLRDQDSDNTGALIARLAPGVSFEAADAEVAALGRRLAESEPSYARAGLRAELVPLVRDVTGQSRPALIALTVAVLFLLLVACVNVANLLLARAVDRRGEVAIRASLGATRARLARQVVTEGVVLAGAGAGLGLMLASWGVPTLVALGPAMPRAGDIGIDLGVLAAVSAVTLLAALSFSALPALFLAQHQASSLRTEAYGAGKKQRLSRGLVAFEVALSFALLVGAGLLTRSAVNLQRVEVGFEPENLLTFQVTLPGASVGGPGARAEYFERFTTEIRQLPGVRAVGLTGGLPLGGVVWRQPYGLDGSSPADWGDRSASFRVISSEFFDAMGTRLLAGRAFTSVEDRNENERVAIVGETLAKGLGGTAADALGRSIGFPLDGDPIMATIVGVVEDVRLGALAEAPEATIYVPYRQEASRTVSMAVRTEGLAPGLPDRVRTVASGLDPDGAIPVYDFRDMDAFVEAALRPTRFVTLLIGVFAAVSLVLAAIGLGGVIAYAVGRSSREYGIRMVLGAESNEIRRHVLARGLRPTAIGAVGGFALAAGVSRSIDTLLFDVSPFDPTVYVVVGLTLVSVSLMASWLPARRAAAVEPATTLNER